MNGSRAGFPGKNRVFPKKFFEWSKTGFLAIFADLSSWKLFEILNSDFFRPFRRFLIVSAPRKIFFIIFYAFRRPPIREISHFWLLYHSWWLGLTWYWWIRHFQLHWTIIACFDACHTTHFKAPYTFLWQNDAFRAYFRIWFISMSYCFSEPKCNRKFKNWL